MISILTAKENANLQALLDENPAQSTSELARELNVKIVTKLVNVYVIC